MTRRRLPPSRSLHRKQGTVKQFPLLLVVCEGGTEGRILRDLCRLWHITSAKVVPNSGDPSNVVLVAKDGRVAGQEVWVAFDCDKHEHWASAINDAHQVRFKIAVSNPCFEYWAILLHQDFTRAVSNCEAQSLLKKLHPEFDHSRNPYLKVDVVMPLLADARRRQTILNRRAEDAGNRYGVPMTKFSDLIDRLEKLRDTGA